MFSLPMMMVMMATMTITMIPHSEGGKKGSAGYNIIDDTCDVNNIPVAEYIPWPDVNVGGKNWFLRLAFPNTPDIQRLRALTEIFKFKEFEDALDGLQTLHIRQYTALYNDKSCASDVVTHLIDANYTGALTPQGYNLDASNSSRVFKYFAYVFYADYNLFVAYLEFYFNGQPAKEYNYVGVWWRDPSMDMEEGFDIVKPFLVSFCGPQAGNVKFYTEIDSTPDLDYNCTCG